MYVDVHTHVKDNLYSVKSIDAQDYFSGQIPSGQFYTCGVHPWKADKANAKKLSIALLGMKEQNLIGIGECGLDRVKGPDLSVQKEVFEMQLQLAQKLSLPVIIHQVKTISDILPVLKKFDSLEYVFHGYNGNVDQTQKLLEFHTYFSFGAAIKHQNSKLESSIEIIPVDRLFVETDENELDISDLYDKLASVKNISKIDLSIQVLENFRTVFNRDFNELD